MDAIMAARGAPALTGPPDISSEVRSRRLFAVLSTSIVLALAILSYILRLWARKRSFQKLQVDDWLMGVGLLITFEPAICEYLCKETACSIANPALTRSIGSVEQWPGTSHMERTDRAEDEVPKGMFPWATHILLSDQSILDNVCAAESKPARSGLHQTLHPLILHSTLPVQEVQILCLR
jgi:hypothetical protein